MIAVEAFRGRRVAVFGLGGSGLATAQALAAGGADVLCGDDRAAALAAAASAGLSTADLGTVDLAGFAALVLSPGVPLTHPRPHPSVLRARRAGVPVVGDVALFDAERRARLPGLRLAAITGTNGKSTTTALLGHLLSRAGEAVQVGGNIGRPVLDLDAVAGTAVVECSSYQIDLAPDVQPDVGALLNLSADHLDRHGSFAAYAAIKERLVAASAEAVVGIDDEPSAAAAERRARAGQPLQRIGTFDSAEEAARRIGARGVAAVGERLFLVADGVARPLASLTGIASLRGRHNAQNVAAALAMALALGVPAEAAVAGLASFPGLAHRMEEVGRLDDVLFVNDSKATNAQSARQALAAFERIHWIAGGVAKAGGIDDLADLFARVQRAYLIGEATDAFAATLAGRVATVRCGTLEVAVAEAAQAARADGGVVLLSPACASFDQFRSFEHRGDRFREIVAQFAAREIV